MLLGNGNVGIGITNPTNNLHISGSGSTTVLMLENTETGANKWGFHSMGSVRTGRLEIQSQGGTDTIPFTIEKSCPSHTLYLNSAGNVGIGITAPLTKLEITGDASEYIKVYNQGTSGDRAGLIMCNDSANNLAGGDTPQWAGFIDWEVGGDDLFIGHYRNYVRNEYIILNNSGNVGIGITSPVVKLDVYGSIVSRGTPADINKGIRLKGRNEDGASYTTYNGGLQSWQGIGFECTFDSTTRHMFNTRNGDFIMTGALGIGYTNPQNKLEVLGDIKCGNPANTLTALDIDTNSSFAYGIYIGGWSSGGLTASNSTIEMSSNLHIDSPSSGSIGPGDIYLNYYNSARYTYIRNKIDISDKRIKKDIVEIETQEQFNDTFEIIKKIGSYKYKYRDTYRENDLDQYGFIAQEVLEHYPVASKLAGDNCYLPNIMKTLNFTYEIGDDNEYTFTIEGYDLDVNIKYLFYGFPIGVEQFNYLENIEPITNNTFSYTPSIIKNEEPPTYIKLVLVGTYTDDKLGVSKDKLFQLGFAGVRGLIDENEKMKNEILELKENQKKIIQKLNELINSDGWFKNSI